MFTLDHNLLTHLLGYACDHPRLANYQSIMLTCKLFNACTRSPLFWAYAIRKGLQNLLTKIGTTNVPSIVYQDFNPFFRPKRTHYLPPDLPQHTFLKWLFFPNDHKLSMAKIQEDGSTVVMIREKETDLGMNFRWALKYELCEIAVGIFTEQGMVHYGVFFSTTFLRHERLIYTERIGYWDRFIRIMHVECLTTKNETVKLWYGRGIQRPPPLEYDALPDETDPDGRFEDIE